MVELVCFCVALFVKYMGNLTSCARMQMTEKEAKRASISVRLLYEFLQLLQEAHTRARELESLDNGEGL